MGKVRLHVRVVLTVFRAELTAIVEALRVACSPLVVHTDNEQVIDGWEVGEDGLAHRTATVPTCGEPSGRAFATSGQVYGL